MSQLIDFKDFNPKDKFKRLPDISLKKSESDFIETHIADDSLEYKLALNVLVHNHPGKELFSLKETADIISVGVDFIRRRIKSGRIKGDLYGG